MENKIDGFSVAAGVVFTLGGVVLLVLAVLGAWPAAIYGLVLLVIGIVILITLRQQEYIEPIKGEKHKNKKRVEKV